MTQHDLPPTPPPSQGPRVTAGNAKNLSRLVRTSSASPEGRHIAGVAGGIARHLDIDPLLVRVLLAVAAFFGGAGLILYVACWLLVPDESDGGATITVDAKSRAIALWLALGLSGVALISDISGGLTIAWWVIPFLIVGVIWAGWNKANEPKSSTAGSEWDLAKQETIQAFNEAKESTTKAFQEVHGQALQYADQAKAKAEANRLASQARTAELKARGPILFWFTMALSALAVGILGVFDLAGSDISASAYPAVVLAVIALMLLIGSFWGRAGGLIAVGLIVTAVLASTMATERWDGISSTRTYAPTTGAQVLDEYSTSVGAIELDLRSVADLESLDGREIVLDVAIGKIDVLLPNDIGLSLEGEVDGIGTVDLLGHRQEGIDVSAEAGQQSGATNVPHLTIRAKASIGTVTMENKDLSR